MWLGMDVLFHDKGQSYPAVVCAVHDAVTADLTVFTPNAPTGTVLMTARTLCTDPDADLDGRFTPRTLNTPPQPGPLPMGDEGPGDVDPSESMSERPETPEPSTTGPSTTFSEGPSDSSGDGEEPAGAPVPS